MARALLVRDAGRSDLAEITRIYNEAIETSVATFDLCAFTTEQREGWFGQFGDDDPILVGEVDGRVAGYAYYLPYRTKPAYAATKELTVYVDGAHRGRGVGVALYGELIDRARRRGVHALIAVIAGDNPASERLHRGFGFRPVGRLAEVGRKFGSWVDTTFWQRILDEHGGAGGPHGDPGADDDHGGRPRSGDDPAA